MKSKNRSQTVSNWLKWFDMDIVEENDHYTDLILKNDDIYFRIEDGKVSKISFGYHKKTHKQLHHIQFLSEVLFIALNH